VIISEEICFTELRYFVLSSVRVDYLNSSKVAPNCDTNEVSSVLCGMKKARRRLAINTYVLISVLRSLIHTYVLISVLRSLIHTYVLISVLRSLIHTYVLISVLRSFIKSKYIHVCRIWSSP
jgi:hypothetical protein